MTDRTVLDKFDPLTRVLLLFIIAVTILFFENNNLYLFYSMLIIWLVILNKITLKNILHLTKRLIWIIVIILAFQSLGMYLVKAEIGAGLNFQYLFIIKLLYLSGFSFLILNTITPVELIDSFSRIKLVKHISVNKIFLFIILSYTPKLIADARKIKIIALSRGLSVGNNPFKHIKRFTVVLIPLIVSALHHSRRLTDLLILRGYAVNSEERTSLHQFKFNSKDYILIIAFTIFLLLILNFKFLSSVYDLW